MQLWSHKQSVLVRTNAISVISHFILNDMIRVKGQISFLVGLMEDPSDHVQQLAKVFFTEWGKRGNNPIYNILPECISALMEMPEVNFDKFSRLIKVLIRFVDKVNVADPIDSRKSSKSSWSINFCSDFSLLLMPTNGSVLPIACLVFPSLHRQWKSICSINGC